MIYTGAGEVAVEMMETRGKTVNTKQKKNVS